MGRTWSRCGQPSWRLAFGINPFGLRLNMEFFVTIVASLIYSNIYELKWNISEIVCIFSPSIPKKLRGRISLQVQKQQYALLSSQCPWQWDLHESSNLSCILKSEGQDSLKLRHRARSISGVVSYILSEREKEQGLKNNWRLFCILLPWIRPSHINISAMDKQSRNCLIVPPATGRMQRGISFGILPVHLCPNL